MSRRRKTIAVEISRDNSFCATSTEASSLADTTAQVEHDEEIEIEMEKEKENRFSMCNTIEGDNQYNEGKGFSPCLRSASKQLSHRKNRSSMHASHRKRSVLKMMSSTERNVVRKRKRAAYFRSRLTQHFEDLSLQSNKILKVKSRLFVNRAAKDPSSESLLSVNTVSKQVEAVRAKFDRLVSEVVAMKQAFATEVTNVKRQVTEQLSASTVEKERLLDTGKFLLLFAINSH